MAAASSAATPVVAASDVASTTAWPHAAAVSESAKPRRCASLASSRR